MLSVVIFQDFHKFQWIPQHFVQFHKLHIFYIFCHHLAINIVYIYEFLYICCWDPPKLGNPGFLQIITLLGSPRAENCPEHKYYKGILQHISTYFRKFHQIFANFTALHRFPYVLLIRHHLAINIAYIYILFFKSKLIYH